MPILFPFKELKPGHDLNKLIQAYNLSPKDNTTKLFSQLQAIAKCAEKLSPQITQDKKFSEWEETDRHGLYAHLNSVLYTLTIKTHDIKRIVDTLKQDRSQSEKPSQGPRK